MLQLAGFWIGYKNQIVHWVGVSNDAMHIHFSLLIMIGSGLLLRQRPDNIWSWLIVLMFELFNEYADISGNAPGEGTIDASLHDVYNTMVWPTILLLFGRLIFPPRAKLQPVEETVSGDLADQSFEETPAV